MIILVTGNHGFVGKNLTTYLEYRDFITLGLSRNPVGCNEISYNSLTPEVWRNANAIVHLAGKSHDLKRVRNSKSYYESNYDLTKKLFDDFLASETPIFVFMSSVKAVADYVKGVLVEDAAPCPKSHYGISKQLAEEYVLSQAVPQGKRVFILRPCMIYGYGNKGNLNLLYQLVSKGVPWPLGAFDNQRSYCSIENLMFIIDELISRKDIPSGIYNVADDEPLSTNELIGLISQSQNRTPKIWNVSRSLIKKVAQIGDKIHLPFNSDRLQKLTSSYVVSNAKIKAAIGKPFPLSSREGLLKTFKSFNSL